MTLMTDYCIITMGDVLTYWDAKEFCKDFTNYFYEKYRWEDVSPSLKDVLEFFNTLKEEDKHCDLPFEFDENELRNTWIEWEF